MSSPLPLEQRLRSVTLTPGADAWAGLVRGWWNEHPHPERTTFRSQLGLPTDRPVIMSGHQAEFWHPGIFAKYVATGAAASALGAAGAWVIVDQDANEPGAIRFARREGSGPLTSGVWRALPNADELAASGVPLCSIPAQLPAPIPDGAQPSPALRSIEASLRGQAGAGSVAAQVASALHDCLSASAAALTTFAATRIAATSLFADLVRRMRDDAGACARAYNDAVRAHPGAGMKPLMDGDDPELPLWHIPGSPAAPAPRRRATLRTLEKAPLASLAPRALFMTGLLRLAGCDLFIHGLGGGTYDPITEQWLRSWLGAELAPAAVVTATLTLPLEADVLPPEAIDWSVWRAHHARHDPLLLGDRPAAATKAELLSRINSAKKTGEDPAPAFRELHAMLAAVRTRHAPELAHLASDAARASARRPEAAILHDRTWAAPLYPTEDLAALRDTIEYAFSTAGTTP
jgi:hypothetical protein